MKKHILLVDDDPRFLRLVVPALEEQGYFVVTATSAMEASIEVALHPFDLMIVDGEMPVIDGLTWITEQRKAGNNIPVVFVSAHWRDTSSFCRLNELNVALILHKPISRVMFVEQISKVIGDHVTLSTEEKSQIEDMLAELKREFLLELPQSIDEVKTAVCLARQHADNVLFIKDAVLKAHSMSGTAGSYGFPSVGKLMKKIELSLREIMDKSNHWRTDLCLQIDESLAELSKTTMELDSQRRALLNRQSTADTTARRILILDDCRSFTRRAEALFSAEDYLVYSFSDADLILETVEIIRPNLLILNIAMREVLEICRQLRLSSKWRNLPILFVYSNSDEQRFNEAVNAGGNGWLPKSAANKELVELSNQLTLPQVSYCTV